MSVRVAQRARARGDFWDIVAFLASRSVPASERFIDGFQASLDFLADWPESGALIADETPEFDGVRICPVKGFRNYLIVYRYRGDRIDVLHITHASRDLSALLDDIGELPP